MKKRKPLNASLPTQLVLDFNAVASKQGNGRRDTLLQEILLSFLAKADPESKSVQQLIGPVQPSRRDAKISAQQTARLLERSRQREAIRVSRECAEKILQVTAEARRKGPKAAPRSESKWKQKAS